MKNPLFLLAACAVLASASLLAQPAETVPTSTPAASARPGPKVGEMAPDFTVVGPDGKEMKLSDFRGKTVLIDIWATWCGPCVASMPHNSELAEKHAKDGLVILAVCADDSRANYDGWVKRNAGKYKFLTAHDTPGKDGWDKSVFNTAYGVSGFPTLFLIDKEGRLVGQTSGGGAGENPHVTRLLAKGGVPVDTSHLPPEPAAGPKSIPMMGKTMAIPASGKTAAMVPPTVKLGNLKFDDEVPDFSAIGVDGGEVKLSSFKGKPVLVAFWTGARSPGEDFAKLSAAYKDQGLAVWAINVATERAEFDTWAKANAAALGYTVSWDPAGKAVMEAISYMKFGIGMYPAFMVVDAKGYFRGGLIGMGPKIAAWMRQSLIVAGLKPTAEDKAAADQVMNELFAARDKAPAPAGGGMLLPAPKAPFSEKYGKLQAGQTVPDFTVITPEGKEAKFSDYAKGKTVILDFWATWCGPCQQAMPHYEDIHRRYADKGVVILGVCAFDTRANYDKWLGETKGKYTFATVFDPVGKPASGDKDAMDRTIMKQLTQGVISPLPTTLVINPAGQLVGSYMGYGEGTHDALANLLMLAGVPVADADKPKIFYPAGSTRVAVPAANIQAPPPGPAAAPKPATLAAGAVAPDFVMHDINDKEVRLSDFKGKVVILDFWATWCGPCIASMPHTNDLAAKYADQDVVVLASGTSDTIAKFKDWIPKNQGKYPNLRFAFDLNERDSATFDQRPSSKLYGVVGIPTQFIIGRDGKITATVVGNGGKEDARTEAALARAGVKVDAARVEAGEKQLKAAAEEEANRIAAAKAEELNPTPKFRVTFGKLNQGQPVPDFTAEAPDGTAVKFSELTKGKTTVFMVWSAASGPTAAALDYINGWARRYADQGVLFLGLGAYGSREDFAKWHAANGAKLAFPALYDPIGVPPKPAKPMEEMTDAERTAFRDASRAHFAQVIPMAFLGGVMAPVPNNVVIDPKGNFLGFYVGAGPGAADSLGNLLLRAGVKLQPEDMPKKVFSAEETKEKPPEAKVEMLKIGATAPDFPATDAAGKAVKVSDYRGKVVILDFWATWCGPCLASMPHTQEVAAHYKDQGVVVLASCTSDDRKKFDAWVKANQPLYPDINFSHDPQERGPGRASHKLYGVGGIPQQFIIDREGKVVALVTGYLKGEAILDAALAKAGIKVDPALIEKGALDLKKREMMR